jgi:hypothetical protein
MYFRSDPVKYCGARSKTTSQLLHLWKQTTTNPRSAEKTSITQPISPSAHIGSQQLGISLSEQERARLSQRVTREERSSCKKQICMAWHVASPVVKKSWCAGGRIYRQRCARARPKVKSSFFPIRLNVCLRQFCGAFSCAQSAWVRCVRGRAGQTKCDGLGHKVGWKELYFG